MQILQGKVAAGSINSYFSQAYWPESSVITDRRRFQLYCEI